jgi:hypothetical protein
MHAILCVKFRDIEQIKLKTLNNQTWKDEIICNYIEA